jgi:hypothetical protein
MKKDCNSELVSDMIMMVHRGIVNVACSACDAMLMLCPCVDVQNAWKLSSENFCDDVVCGSIAIWDQDFSHFVKPTEIINRFRQIFTESTEIQVNTGARRIIDFCKHTKHTHTKRAHTHELAIEPPNCFCFVVLMRCARDVM